ncbi:MAG: helix-turn-helix domain-containing protein [Cytophagales bacterium]|nr:helix-turn-helix domain-containing protein [Cytophagales bacterium]
MTLVSKNIKYLRKKHGYTQEQFSEKIGIKRSLLGAYEEGRADPRLNNLMNIAKEFNISVDTLISKNVATTPETALHPPEQSDKNEKFKVLAITTDQHDEENIELIPQKASAGYLNGYADPEYLKELPKFQLPFLPKNSTYRAFEVTGDSMLPLESGTVVIGRYLESVADIVNGRTYVLVTGKEGIVYKRVFNYVEENGKLFLVSDNKVYSPYEIEIGDVLEVWEAKAFISVSFPEPDGEMTLEKLTGIVIDLQQEVIKLKSH